MNNTNIKNGYKIAEIDKRIDVYLINNGANKQKEDLFFLVFTNGTQCLQTKTKAGYINQTIKDIELSPLIEFLK